MASTLSPAEQVLANGDLAREIARLVACGNPSGEHLAKSDRICRAFYDANTPLWKQLCRTRYRSSTYLQGSFSLSTDKTDWRRTFSRRRVAEACLGAPLPRSYARSCRDYQFTFEVLTSADDPVYWGTFGSVAGPWPDEVPPYAASVRSARYRKPPNVVAKRYGALEPDLVARVFVTRDDGSLACLMNTGRHEYEIESPHDDGYDSSELRRDEVSVRFVSTGALPLLQWRHGQRVTGIESSSGCDGVNIILRIKCKIGDLNDAAADDSGDDSEVEPLVERLNGQPVVRLRGATLQFGEDTEFNMCDHTLLGCLELLHWTSNWHDTQRADDSSFVNYY